MFTRIFMSFQPRRIFLILFVLAVLSVMVIAGPAATVSACYGQATGGICCPAC